MREKFAEKTLGLCEPVSRAAAFPPAAWYSCELGCTSATVVARPSSWRLLLESYLESWEQLSESLMAP